MSNPLPMLNGDKTAVGDFSTDASANMVAAIRDHISCTKPVQMDTFVTQDTKAGIIYPCEFDHMYASLTEGTVVERENLEVKHLKDLLLLHLDLIQQQSEQLVTKDKQISSLRQENETLRQRLERMDRRVNLHKQRDGLMPPADNIAERCVNLHKQRDGLMPPADNIAERSIPVPSFESTFVVPKLEPNVLYSTSESVVTATVPTARQPFFRPGTPFPFRRIEFHEEPKYSTPLQHREVPARENGVPVASSTPSVAPRAACDARPEPAKRQRTEEGEPCVSASARPPSASPLATRPPSPASERVPDAVLDSGAAAAHRDSADASHADDSQRVGRGTAAWASCAGRRRRRLHFRHGRSNESESSAVSQPPSPTPGDSRQAGRGRGRRAQQRGRTASGRRRRRSGDAFKDVLSTDHAYWTTIGELPSALRLTEGLGTDCTTVEVPSWRHKVYTSCYAMEGTENLDDEVFSKRHQRYESDERRRKRWDVQRIREQRHIEKLRQQEAARAVSAPLGRSASGHRRGDDNPLASLWPAPEDVTYVEIGEKLPVAAFGAPVSNFLPDEFSLPWKWRPGAQEKVLRRRHHGPYRDAASQQGGAKR